MQFERIKGRSVLSWEREGGVTCGVLKTNRIRKSFFQQQQIFSFHFHSSGSA